MHLRKKKKNFKVVLFVGLMFAVLSLGLITWAGVAAINYTISQVEKPLEKISGFSKDQVSNNRLFYGLNIMNCFEKVQSFLSTKPWLENSATENFLDLKTACIASPKDDCISKDCKQEAESLKTTIENTI